MALTERLREPLADTGCVCCQGLTGAVAFVLGKCLLTSGAPTRSVCVQIFFSCSDFSCEGSVREK